MVEHLINSIASQYLSNTKNVNILDIGPGYKNYLSEFGDSIERDVIEFDEDIIKFQLAETKVNNVFKVDLSEDQVSNQIKQRYDIILMIEVLEHVVNPVTILTEIKQLLKPGGILLLTVPTRFSERIMFRINKNYNKNTLFPHVNFFNKNGLEELLKFSGFIVLISKQVNFHYFLFHVILHYLTGDHNISDGSISSRKLNELHDFIVNPIRKVKIITNKPYSILGRNYFIKATI